VMFRGQAKRYFPLPDYDLTEANHVKVRLAGRFIDENYSRMLLSLPDIGWSEILALDQIQKSAKPDADVLQLLRKRGLVEGRKSAPYISAEVAKVTGQKADYIRTRGQDDAYYRKLVTDYLGKFHEASKEDLRKLVLPKLPDALSAKQKETKLQNMLTSLRKAGVIARVGGLQHAKWCLHIEDAPGS
jgi:ATP-dependent DNA helicase RecG